MKAKFILALLAAGVGSSASATSLNICNVIFGYSPAMGNFGYIALGRSNDCSVGYTSNTICSTGATHTTCSEKTKLTDAQISAMFTTLHQAAAFGSKVHIELGKCMNLASNTCPERIWITP